VRAEQPLTLAKTPGEAAPFGVEQYALSAEEPGGALDAQAGSHPFQLTTTVDLNQRPEQQGRPVPAQLAKDLTFNLPPGLIGDPTAYPRCTLAQFTTYTSGAHLGRRNGCPSGSVIGIALSTFDEEGRSSGGVVPVFNLEPSVGEPARFGYQPGGVPVFLGSSVRTGGDYGVTVHVQNITQFVGFLTNTVTFWGVPGDPRHESLRGYGCKERTEVESGTREFQDFPCEAPPASSLPFLSLPTSCTGALHSTMEGVSWSEFDQQLSAGRAETQKLLKTAGLPALDGCGLPQFGAEIKVSPDVQAASSPSGLKVDVHVPQELALNPQGLAAAAVKNITVALPAGVHLNPSASDGLAACTGDPGALPEGALGSPGDQIGYEGKRELPSLPGSGTLAFSPYQPGSITAGKAGDLEPLRPGLNFCPNASKVGTVTIRTPILPHPIEGFVYLASQEANPFGSLFAMYIVAEDPVSGTLVKLPGELTLCKGAGEDPRGATGEPIPGVRCEALGQLISTFKDNPQAPLEDAELHFFGGERAPLATPVRCGSYTTNAYFEPWTNPPAGNSSSGAVNEVVHAESHFAITSGPKTLSEPGGTPCPGASLPFKPTLRGAALNVNAGAFSPFTATMSRLSGEENLQSLEVHLPPGLSGILSNIELCPEPQANLGECGPNSLIGETTVGVGVGGEPYTVSGGRFYLTGPYNGTGGCAVGAPGCAPFGITFEVPAKAGPFDLANTKNNHPPCDCIVTRGKIEINPQTAAITITSDPPGSPHAIPTSIEGIPLEIQHVNAITTRSNFQFNPTNCSKMEVTGTIHSSEGGTDTIGVPFQVTNCKNLEFTPKFTVSTSGRTSKVNGTSLTTKVTEPIGSLGTQSNIARVKVDLPVQLPSRLTTLQKACLAAQFESNPAGCPGPSVIGHAKVSTPLIPVPLEGPVYFVSHGGEAFPSLEIVLQGYGVKIILVGTTFISKAGITSTTFKTVPDQPFSTFELTLPQGKYSALGANLPAKAKGSFCGQNLKMPTEFVAQNGAVIHQQTPIAVTGCKTLTRAQKLKAALNTCRKQDKHNKATRQACERAASRKYGPVKRKGKH